MGRCCRGCFHFTTSYSSLARFRASRALFLPHLLGNHRAYEQHLPLALKHPLNKFDPNPPKDHQSALHKSLSLPAPCIQPVSLAIDPSFEIEADIVDTGPKCGATASGKTCGSCGTVRLITDHGRKVPSC